MNECDCCNIVSHTVYDINKLAFYPVFPEYLCEDCAEKRWDKQQEELMENAY